MTTTITNSQNALTGSGSAPSIDNAKDVARKIPLTDLAPAVPGVDSIPGQLGTNDIGDAAVTAAKLATDAVETAKVKNANITTGKLAAGAATLAKQTLSGKKTTIFRGKNGAGAITGLTGLVIGDRVESVTLIGTAADMLLAVLAANTGNPAVTQPTPLFESGVTVVDQLQQVSATDLSANLYLLVAAPAAA